MKNKNFIIGTLGVILFSNNVLIVSAQNTEMVLASNRVVERNRAREVNTTNSISAGSNKYGNFTITIKVNGVINMDSSGNVVSDHLNFSYSCKYPIKVDPSIVYNSSKVTVFYFVIVTYPDGSKQHLVQDYSY